MLDLRDPLLQAAVRNRRHISDFDYRVLSLAVPYLTETEARVLKAEVLAAELGVDRSNVNRALRNLVDAGFLIRVDRSTDGRSWTYRLPRAP